MINVNSESDYTSIPSGSTSATAISLSPTLVGDVSTRSPSCDGQLQWPSSLATPLDDSMKASSFTTPTSPSGESSLMDYTPLSVVILFKPAFPNDLEGEVGHQDAASPKSLPKLSLKSPPKSLLKPPLKSSSFGRRQPTRDTPPRTRQRARIEMESMGSKRRRTLTN